MPNLIQELINGLQSKGVGLYQTKKGFVLIHPRIKEVSIDKGYTHNALTHEQLKDFFKKRISSAEELNIITGDDLEVKLKLNGAETRIILKTKKLGFERICHGVHQPIRILYNNITEYKQDHDLSNYKILLGD